MKRIAFLFTAALLMLSSATSQAADVPPKGFDTAPKPAQPSGPPPSKATLVVAEKLARMVLPQDGYKEKMDHMVKAIHAAQPVAKAAKLPPDFWLKLRVGLERRLPYDEMVTDQAASFAAKYTPEELKKLIAFYESPLGKKALKVMPEVMNDATLKAEQHFTDRMPSLLEELKAEHSQASPAPAATP